MNSQKLLQAIHPCPGGGMERGGLEKIISPRFNSPPHGLEGVPCLEKTPLANRGDYA